MSLKGYQWLDEKGKVVFSYRFKDRTIDVWKDTTKEEYDKFRAFLERHGIDGLQISGMNFHWHKVKGYLELEEEN